MSLRSIASGLAVSLVASALCFANPCVVRADPPACPADPPSDAEVQRRLAWIERHVDPTERDTRWWFTGFLALHGLLTGVQLTLAIATPDDDARPDFIVNTISSGLGLITMAITTPPILGAGEFIRGLPRDTPEARLDAMRAAERRLQQSAEASGFVRSELSALASALYVEAASLTLLFLGRTSGAFLLAGGGVVLGQGRLLLHPTGAIDAWRTYSARHADAGCESDAPVASAPGPSLAVSPSVPGPGGVGVSLQLAF
ncbi:hypothetical protein [Sandaracinus amylolyticus]|uniref:hypothetical protein n=1 Tax=Sandaracinus amylolyticus TaxID=927083 RepID=UPI001F171E2B|nr:hypothetical protein [Sandaracinus amylolyticus]